MKSNLKIALVMLVTGLLYFYFFLPALNIHDISFWFLLLVLAAEFLALKLIGNISLSIGNIGRRKEKVHVVNNKFPLSKAVKIVAGCAGLVLAYIVLTGFIFSPLLNAKSYANRITVENVSFEEVPPYSFNQTAIIDRDSAENLGNKVMGEMTDLISQFSVSDEYSQISYQGGTYRVTPLAYDGLIKYIRNRSSGIPGYILVNTTTGETNLIRTEKTMHYVPSAPLWDNLMRKLRFSYPFAIFGDPTFEIDEQGNPYYVCTTYTYRGVNSLKRVNGVILFDPTNGQSQYYSIEDCPTWVDRIYPESLVTQELNDYGLYQKGFLNSILGQEGVKTTSEGYNYISKEGDIWLYTGMTSVLSDASNIGFALVNLRTHEAQFIQTSGADEYSVMASAEGEVLNYGYTATFPVLVNIDNRPVYLLSLKDSAGLIKMYAMVDARDYQQVYTIKAERNAKVAIDALIAELSGDTYIPSETETKTITVETIKQAIIDGNTIYYIKAQGIIYKAPLSEENAEKLLFLESGDTLSFTYSVEDGTYLIHTIQ